MKLTRGCSSACWLSTTGALVIEAFSFAAAGLRDLVALWYSLVPLEASDLESSTIAVVRWRGGAIAPGARGWRDIEMGVLFNV